MNRFSPAAKLILVGGLIWISFAVAVLLSGLRSSQVPSAASEVAMQMAVLSFPSSVGVGWLLNALAHGVKAPSGYSGIVCAWIPFFIAGCLQIVGLMGLAGGLRRRP